MRNTLSVLALATSAAATGFRGANPFSCPANTDNKCTSKQSSGFDFSDLPFGGFSSYNDFVFKGWTCGASPAKRFEPRTLSGGRSIGGVCSQDASSSPSFGCGVDIEAFSLTTILVQPEFDCDLEFHYGMPDGSTCKHRTACSHSGTSVNNAQCGGAKNVTIVYPSQPSKPKPTCSVNVHTMSFDCSTASTTVYHATTTTKAAIGTTSTAEALTTTTSAVIETTATATTTSTAAAETTSSTSVFVTSYLSTSTIFTTVTSTITSCAATVTNCPAESQTVATTVVTVAVSTTVCPVTETQTSVVQAVTSTSTGFTFNNKTSTTILEAATSTTTKAALATTSSTSPAPPVETLPCPEVVPSCLNTFLFSVGCSDNTDSACYCPNEIFVSNIFDCIYAHGESDEIVSQAVLFVQGLCAPWVGSNPGIATGATVTSYVTATATPLPTSAVVYTTMTVEATTVVPCTDESGSIIPSSSSTQTIQATLTVPQVGFTTTGSQVAVIPISSFTPQAAETIPAYVTPSGAAPTGVVAASTTVAIGTGRLTPTGSPSGIVTVNGGERVSAGFGLALAVMGLIAAL